MGLGYPSLAIGSTGGGGIAAGSAATGSAATGCAAIGAAIGAIAGDGTPGAVSGAEARVGMVPGVDEALPPGACMEVPVLSDISLYG